MEYFLIYLIGTVDGLKEFFNFVGTMGALFCIGAFCIFRVNFTNNREDTAKESARKSFKSFVFFLALFIFTQLIPNSKTLVAMITIPPVINNEQVKELPENVLGFINDYIKEKRDELQGVSGSSGKV